MVNPNKPADRPRSGRFEPEEPPSGAKLLIELGPLVLFALAYLFYGLKVATGVLMVTSVASIVAARVVLGHVAPMLFVTAIISVFCGALVFLLDDPKFIKIKPTVVNAFFVVVLVGGLMRGQLLLKHVLGSALRLTDAGWRLLTHRWIGFFAAMAVANEVVWRNFSEGTWVSFKLVVVLITFAFAIAQIGLIKAHTVDTESA